MLFAQFAGLDSLREIEQALGAQPGGLYHLGLRVPRRSTLSDAQTCRPAAVFRDICMHLMAHAKRSVRREAAEIVELIDATPIPLRDPRFTWAKADSRVRGLKVHVGYDARAEVIEWAEITAPNTTDIAVARARPIEPGRTYVFDKGYLDYNWWRRLHDGQARFVSRLKSNTRRRDVIAQPVHGQGIMADNLLKLGHAAPRGGARNELYGITLREIVVERDGKEPLHLVTNDLDRPASDIAALYKERWQVELLFKWLKQNLKIRRFLGRSENAVKIQIYVAIIAFLLMRLFQNAHGPRHSAKALMTRIAVCLFGRFDITNTSPPPPRHPSTLPPNPQLKLAI